MSPTDFKKWRVTIKLTQVAASDLLGVSRVTVQNWENGQTRIPVAIEAACELHQRRSKMRDDYGPVTLTHLDAPMWQSAYGPATVPRMNKELYPDNASAIARACQLRSEPGIHNLLISDESREIIWNSVQLDQECEKRARAPRAIGTAREA